MLKKKRMYLYFLMSIGVLLVFVFFMKQDKMEKEVKDDTPLQESKSIEVSEIAKNDKDFYSISTKKDKILHNKHKYFQMIKEMFTTNNAYISEMDKVMTALLMDKNIPRIDKINGLWSILKEIGFNSQKSEYLLDALGTLMPVELTSELIAMYGEKSSSHTMKLKMIEMLSGNLQIANPEVQDEKSLQFIMDKQEEIQAFIKEKVLSDSNEQIASEGLRAYASMSGSQEVEELITSLYESEQDSYMNSDAIRKMLTETALSTTEAQEDMLPSMLNDMENNPDVDAKQKEAFTQMMIESLNAGVLTEVSGEELTAYMKSNEPALHLNDSKSETDISKYYHWVEASSKIKDSDTSLVDTALNNDNPLKVSSILLYGDSQTIQKIKNSSNVEDMHAMLELALNDNSINVSSKTIIDDALGVLEEGSQNVHENIKERK
jgi:hypothetical protein